MGAQWGARLPGQGAPKEHQEVHIGEDDGDLPAVYSFKASRRGENSPRWPCQ